MRRRWMSLGLTLLLAANSGCSFAMKRAPNPVRQPDRPIACTTSSALPVLDTVCVGTMASFMLVETIFAECPDFPASCNPGGWATAGAIGVACLVSAVSGYSEARRCEVVQRQNALCIGGDAEACRALAPGWKPAPPAPTTPPAAGRP